MNNEYLNIYMDICKPKKTYIISQQTMTAYIGNSQVRIQFDKDGNITSFKQFKETNITMKGQQKTCYVTDDPKFKTAIQDSAKNSSQSREITGDEYNRAKQGMGTDVWNTLKNGGCAVCQGVGYLLEGTGKLLAWPFKAIGNLAKSPNEQVNIKPARKDQLQEYIFQNGKQPTEQEKKLPMYQTVQNQFIPGQFGRDTKQPERLWAKTQDKKIITAIDPKFSFNDANRSMQQKVLDNAIAFNGAFTAPANFKSGHNGIDMSNPLIISAANKRGIKLKDPKQKNWFQALISKMFGGFLMNNQEEYQEYTEAQLQGFTPYIYKLVKNGALPPGEYVFTYKG